MVNRIFAFIESKQLTPTEFADKIGVSRAAISSIKTGRTQPTLTLVEKMKLHFPDIDVNWLIFGEGELKVVDVVAEGKDDQPRDLFSSEGIVQGEDEDANKQPMVANDYEAVYIAEAPREKNPSIDKQCQPQIEKEPSAIDKNKSIKKVILLYSDGSFEEFNK